MQGIIHDVLCSHRKIIRGWALQLPAREQHVIRFIRFTYSNYRPLLPHQPTLHIWLLFCKEMNTFVGSFFRFLVEGVWSAGLEAWPKPLVSSFKLFVSRVWVSLTPALRAIVITPTASWVLRRLQRANHHCKLRLFSLTLNNRQWDTQPPTRHLHFSSNTSPVTNNITPTSLSNLRVNRK